MRREAEVQFTGIGGQPIQGIGAEYVTFTIHSAHAKYGGKQVAAVPVGERFQIEVEYSCSFPVLWSTFWGKNISITASTIGIDVYDNQSLFPWEFEKNHAWMTLDNPSDPVMPETRVIFGLQGWFSSIDSDYFSPPPKPW